MSPTPEGALAETMLAHDPVTLALAKRESAHHCEGAEELFNAMRGKPLWIQAYEMDDPSAPPLTNSNVKVCHFLRHGQGFHNLMADMYALQGKQWTQFIKSPENPYVMPEIVDAPLTQKGRNQARAAQSTIKRLENQPEIIVLSPQCRAVQTGLIAFEHLVEKVPFIAHEMVREQTGVHVCDMRRPKSQQMLEFPKVDFGLIEKEEDHLFQEDRRESILETGERIHDFLTWLEQRGETHIAVASHSGWLMTLFNGSVKCEDSLKEWFQTGELRSVMLEFVKNE
mmetsp:Transcript_23852/g.35377  ORF Transcript_23852/g.35377 Transcript_23852/m.35377 type:complete len:283 (-) Transcript_23852:259-1107(-)